MSPTLKELDLLLEKMPELDEKPNWLKVQVVRLPGVSINRPSDILRFKSRCQDNSILQLLDEPENLGSPYSMVVSEGGIRKRDAEFSVQISYLGTHILMELVGQEKGFKIVNLQGEKVNLEPIPFSQDGFVSFADMKSFLDMWSEKVTKGAKMWLQDKREKV